jgi:hypothetical protein
MTRTVEAAREIDVDWCNREGVFDHHGQSGIIRWRREGEETASVSYAYTTSNGEDVLRLSYTVTPLHGESRAVAYGIPVEWQACHFGGARPWFRCPVCDDRVGAVYDGRSRDEYACRECQGLLYESQTHTGAYAEAFQRVTAARERVEAGDVSREALREFYEAQQGLVSTFNDAIGGLDDTYGEHGRASGDRINALPPFEQWVDGVFHRSGGGATDRAYGFHGRCTATAKTTGERCRQPATGEHGTCHYHGGARGSAD